MNLEEICSKVKEILSEKRYNHSIGVMEKAGELAKIYGVNVETAKKVGIAHDIAKELSNEEAYEYIENHNIYIDEIERIQPHLLHGKIGADMCKNLFNFTQEMQNAIIYHTTGNKNMDILAKIIYLSDKTEKNRDYDGVEELRKLAEKNLDDAVIQALERSIIRNVKAGNILHQNTLITRNELMIKKIYK